MPVLIVGADTVHGSAIARALETRPGERRAFVSDPDAAASLRQRGWKTAIGDVSDGSHVGGAAVGCFSVILVPEAAFDDRERSFARSPAATIGAWASALREVDVRRIIWLDDPRVDGAVNGFRSATPEVASVTTLNRNPAEIAAEVARLDDLERLDEV
jgi:uncharacterized protein YbjT (DUF2867 family)